MRLNFCSYFDKNYISKFLVLFSSLNKFEFEFKFYVLALDVEVEEFFKTNPNTKIEVIRIKDLEAKYVELLEAKKNRSLIEYYFTLSPFLPRYVNLIYKIHDLSYLDSDFYFLKNPKQLIERNLDSSIVLIKQFSNPKFGLYNVGWIRFNFEFDETKIILEKWSKQCLNSCFDVAKNNLYADQKYLDDWPSELKFVRILYPEYTNLSPWDSNLNIERNLDNSLSFHFHGLVLKKNYFISGFHKYNKKVPNKVLQKLYYPYINNLLKIEKKFKIKTDTIRNKLDSNKFELIKSFKILNSGLKTFLFNDKHKITE